MVVMLLDILTPILGQGYHWQDIIIAIVSLMFGFILLPQLRDIWHGKTILNLYTAGFTTIGLFILTVTFFTMGFWISFIADFFSGIVWLFLFAFSFKNIKKKGK
jgi:hypothetical protein